MKENKNKIRPITAQELLDFLEKVNDKKRTVVGLAVDSEGNGFSLIPNDLFWSGGYVENELGTIDCDEVYEEKTSVTQVPAIILWPSN